MTEVNYLTEALKSYRTCINDRLVRMYGVTTEEAGIELKDLILPHEAGWSPADYVSLFAEKQDLRPVKARQTAAPIRHQVFDPVIGLFESERMARDAFEACDKMKDKEAYDRAEKHFLDVAEMFQSTPATSLAGLMLQARYLKEHNDVDEADILIAGIANLMKEDCEPQPLPSMANDAVIAHGRELAKVLAAEAAIEEKEHEEGTEIQYEAQSQHFYDRATALENLIAATKATSLEGALLQVGLIFSQLNSLDSFEYDRADIRKLFRTCCRLLYSVRDVLQNACGVKPEELAVNHYMGDIQNPWLEAEERIKIAQAFEQPKAA